MDDRKITPHLPLPEGTKIQSTGADLTRIAEEIVQRRLMGAPRTPPADAFPIVGLPPVPLRDKCAWDYLAPDGYAGRMTFSGGTYRVDWWSEAMPSRDIASYGRWAETRFRVADPADEETTDPTSAMDNRLDKAEVPSA